MRSDRNKRPYYDEHGPYDPDNYYYDNGYYDSDLGSNADMRKSDYERDVELYRKIIADDKAGMTRAPKADRNITDAGDAGTPHFVGRRKRRVVKKRHDVRRGIQGKQTVRKKHRLRKLISSILVIILLVLTAGYGYFAFLVRNMDKVSTSGADFGVNSGVSRKLWRYSDIAILGSDARAGEGYDGSRTDAVVIMRIDKLTGETRLISVMRDSYLKMNYTDGTQIFSKLTHAHSFGGGVNTCRTLNRCLDLNIHDYVIFNWRAVADVVSSLGGIELTVSEDELIDMATYGPATAANIGTVYKPVLRAGRQKLNGAQTATYCRIRKTSGSDEGRARRYKAVLSAVISKAKTAGIKKLNNTAKRALPRIRTNMSSLDMYLWLIQAWRININGNVAWPEKYYGGILRDGSWYAVPQDLEAQVRSLHKKAFNDDDYQCSNECVSISNEISEMTGVR